ncbi:Coagulation factor V [Acropora cervicornis]|uniref:Coagulation factor V n=1 Tax=Acropora cervicornis TaxID=6130 RepID=A0AAD9R223_ACRCE|nr:Coagulation factor V [Acropora cervicornis]
MCTREMDLHRLLKELTAVQTFVLLVFVVGNLRFEIIGAARPGCSNPLGLEGGFEDRQFKSYTFKDGYDPFMGRLNNDGGWCSRTNDNNHEFLEIELQNVQHISGIATQGVPGSSLNSDSYVKTFLVEYSFNRTKWYPYEDSGGSAQTYYRHMCLRVELYGCNDPSDDCSRYITTASGSINSSSFLGSYPANKDCTWLIEISNNKIISFMFTLFDVYQGSNPESCDYDYVEVRDGLTDSSPVIGEKYCNQKRPMLITTKKNVARIYFHTGIDNHGHKGFRLYFLSVTKGYQNTISILHAWYQVDSFPFSCGQRHDYSSSTSCPAFNAMGEIVSKCQGYKKCLISVSDSSFPGHSCAKVRRRLEVFYQCNSLHDKTTAPTPQLTTSTKSAPTASPVAINMHVSHSLTSHVTESPIKVKATETHAVTVSNTLPRSTDLITSNGSGDPTLEKDPITDAVNAGIIVSVIFVEGGQYGKTKML